MSSNRDVRSSVTIRVGESDEGYEIYQKINAYRKSKGWTWRHLILVGIAEVIHDDNPILTEEIAELLTAPNKRPTKH